MSEENAKPFNAKANTTPPSAQNEGDEEDDMVENLSVETPIKAEIKPAAVEKPKAAPKPKAVKVDDDDDEPFLPVDDEDDALPVDASMVVADTSERTILVVDEESQRRNETVTIIQQILPNATIEVADDPEEALEMMLECDFDTYVVNFLMPGYSNSKFVKSVANHPEHPLLVGFAADKMSDALDPKKGLKIIPLKRLFDLSGTGASDSEGEGRED